MPFDNLVSKSYFKTLVTRYETSRQLSLLRSHLPYYVKIMYVNFCMYFFHFFLQQVDRFDK